MDAVFLAGLVLLFGLAVGMAFGCHRLGGKQ